MGYIYKIVCNKTGLTYYGSTSKQLRTRLKEHECRFKKNNGGKYSCYEILENNDYKIELVEEVSCETKKQFPNWRCYFYRHRPRKYIIIPIDQCI